MNHTFRAAPKCVRAVVVGLAEPPPMADDRLGAVRISVHTWFKMVTLGQRMMWGLWKYYATNFQ